MIDGRFDIGKRSGKYDSMLDGEITYEQEDYLVDLCRKFMEDDKYNYWDATRDPCVSSLLIKRFSALGIGASLTTLEGGGGWWFTIRDNDDFAFFSKELPGCIIEGVRAYTERIKK